MSQESLSLVVRMAERFKLDPEEFFETLKKTAFKQKEGVEITNEQMIALLVVCEAFELNPFLKEIYAFLDKWGSIVPVVSIDGWSNIINRQPDYDGMEFRYSENRVETPETKKVCFEWMECVIWRKSRSRPTVIREYFDEVYRPMSETANKRTPWQSHPKRFHRHKVTIQTGRLAFGFAGIYDEDEAERIIEVREGLDEPATSAITDQAVPTQLLSDVVKLDDFIVKLVDRAKGLDDNGWAASRSYASDRVKNPVDLAYIQQKLSIAEKECLEETCVSEEETQPTAEVTDINTATV